MATHWSRLECELIVEDYLDMLAAECRQEPYNKAEHNRKLREKLQNRSRPSVEFKHRNITAIMLRAQHAYIVGYQPAWNYQELLETVVLDRLTSDDNAIAEIEASLIEQVVRPTQVLETGLIIVEPPERTPDRQVRETRTRTPRKINYAEREIRNRALGEKGEEFVLEFERRRLVEIGRADLVNDVEWTSKEKGDGSGYDIQSFQGATDKPLYIEVKTTNSGKYQPFMISANEVAFSTEYFQQFALYRVFEFSRSPFLFVLDGSVDSHVSLSPTMYRAQYSQSQY